LRILLIHQYFLEDDDSGGSRFNEITKIWVNQGHEVVVLAGMMHYSGSEKRKEYRGRWIVTKRQGDVTVVRCNVSESYNKNFVGRLMGYFSFVISSIWAGVFTVKGKFDIILVTSPPLFVGITAYFLSRMKGIPFVFEVRDLWPESAIDTGVISNKYVIKLAYSFEKFIYRKAKLINTLTPAFREVLIEEKKVASDKVIMIPNAADFSLSSQLLISFDVKSFRRQQGTEDNFVITYVGAHGVANHLSQLLEVAERLRDTNVIIQLIGDGMEKQSLKKIALDKQLVNIKFIESVPKSEVFKYILASDMGTSVLKKADTFKTIYSNKTFDYMSCKKPVLMLIDGISKQLIEEANCGYYAEPENINEIESVIKMILNEKEKLPELGKNGYTFAKKHFDREVLAEDYLNHLMKVAVHV
jgi:glycosyltransferase involved in cell wall biosynthesis